MMHLLGDDMVSIIVPVYNVVKYIDKCITSIISQTYRDIEAIFIDDCSDDGTSEILDRYALEDSRITIVHQCARGGVSRARNIGLSKARGEYIMFVDSDDWIDDDIVEKCVNNFQKGNVNYFGFKRILPNGKAEVTMMVPVDFDKQRMIADVIHMYKDDEKYFTYSIRCVCGKLFEKSIIEKNNIRFKEGLQIGEDGIFMLQYYWYTDGINLISSIGYNCNCTNTSSLTRGYNPARYEQKCMEYENTKQVLYGLEGYKECDIVSGSLINSLFTMADSLLGANLKAFRRRLIPLDKCFSDSISFLDRYKKEIKGIKLDDTSYVDGGYRVIYKLISLPSSILVFFMLFLKIARKAERAFPKKNRKII